MKQKCLEQCESILQQLKNAESLWKWCTDNVIKNEYIIKQNGDLKTVFMYINEEWPTNMLIINANNGMITSSLGIDQASIPIPDKIAQEIFDFEYELYENSRS